MAFHVSIASMLAGVKIVVEREELSQMAEIFYPTKYKAKGPWLIDSEQLLTLDDSLDAHFAKSLAAGVATDGQASGGSGKSLEKRITFSFRHDKQLETTSFKEAISHPEVMNEIVTALRYEASMGSVLGVLTLERNKDKEATPFSDDELDLSITVEPRGELVSEQMFTVMKNWSDDIEASLWQKLVFGLRGFARVVFIFWLVIFGVYLFTPSPATYKDYYKQEARKLLDQGINSGNQQKAVELLLAIQTGTAPAGVRPGRDSKAIAINLIGLIGVSALALLPGLCIGVGKGKRLLRRWRYWFAFVFVTVPGLLVSHYLWPQVFALIDQTIGRK